MTVMTDAELIGAECDALKLLLIEKSKAYGSSWRDPLRVFSAADTVEQLRVRIDDKLSRIKRGGMTAADGREEDVVLDLLGYLVLYRIAVQKHRVAEACEEMGQPDQREDRHGGCAEVSRLHDPAFWEAELARHDTLCMDSEEDRAALARFLAAAVGGAP